MSRPAPWIAAALVPILLAIPARLAEAAPHKKPAAAAEQKETSPDIERLGGAQGWEAYSETSKGHKICYLIGEPSKSEPGGLKRSKIYASITHRPAEKAVNEVSFNAGYLFKEGSNAELLVDSRKFSLFTNKEGAWTRDAATDKAVVEALAKGKTAVLKGVSARGTETTDVYTLAGFSQALARIDKACNVRR